MKNLDSGQHSLRDVQPNTEITSVDGDKSCSTHDGDIVRSFAMLMKCRYLFAGTMYGRVYCFDLQDLKTLVQAMMLSMK